MQFKEIVNVFCMNRTKHINTLCKHYAELLLLDCPSMCKKLGLEGKSLYRNLECS